MVLASEHGVKAEACVGICCEKSAAMLSKLETPEGCASCRLGPRSPEKLTHSIADKMEDAEILGEGRERRRFAGRAAAAEHAHAQEQKRQPWTDYGAQCGPASLPLLSTARSPSRLPPQRLFD